MIAVCGLDCGGCEIRLAPTDADAARSVIAWFQQMGWLAEHEGLAEVIERRMVCQGCRGDRSVHWSADCWILQCCVDEKHLAYCHECAAFPCQRLIEWSQQNTSYIEALNRLRRMKAGLDDN